MGASEEQAERQNCQLILVSEPKCWNGRDDLVTAVCGIELHCGLMREKQQSGTKEGGCCSSIRDE